MSTTDLVVRSSRKQSHRRSRRHRRASQSVVRAALEALEGRRLLTNVTFPAGSLIVDMGQPTQTVGNALKPYGLVYDMVTNYKVPVNWAIDPAKMTFRLDTGDPAVVDFTATTTTGVKSYSGGSFIIDEGFLTPALLAELQTWKTQGVVIDTLAAPLTTEIYGQVTSFPRAVLDLQNGSLAIPYYANAGVPSTSYRLGNPTDLVHCDDVYILPHADPQDWTDAWKQALYSFVDQGGGLWAGCHSGSALEDLTSFTSGGVTQRLNFLSNDLVPWGSHSGGTLPYTYNAAAANDPVMQIMNRLDVATTNGSEQIYVPTAAEWRSTTTVAVYDPDHPNNPIGGTSPSSKAAVVAYGYAYGDPSNGLVMYEAGHSLAKSTASANIAAQRAFFNFILTEGINKAPVVSATAPVIVPGQASTITATISGGSGTYSYQFVSSNGGIFSNAAGTWHVGDPPITTQYQMTGAEDTIRLLITDVPCGRQTIWSASVSDAPPTIDLDADNSSGATGADYAGFFQGGGAVVPAADPDVLVTDNGTIIQSAGVKLTTRPDGAAETLLIDDALAADYGISVSSDGAGGFVLSGTATLAEYQAVIASLEYFNQMPFPSSTDRVITVTVNDGISDSNTAVSRLSYLGGAVATVDKYLYLSDPGQGMDRVDPGAAPVDTTTSSVPVIPVVSNDSTGWAAWSNSAKKNLETRPWNLTAYGTQKSTTTDGGSYITMSSAASPKRNEAIVVGVTSDRHVSGAVWNGSSWMPISISIGGKTVQNLGQPTAAPYWGAAVAYETNSGRAMLVWNTGSTLNYSIWNGSSWTAASTISAYTGTEPRQIRLAANPLSGSNEIVLVTTSKAEVDRALVWNGTSWGNQIQLDNNTGHNYTDTSVVYEQQSGRAMVAYASGTGGAVGYNIWNGSSWSAASTIAAPSTSNNYAQWTVMAADPNSNRIVLGVESNGKDAWMNVWSGSAWGTAQLGVQDGVTDNNNLEVAVAFESRSGDALAVYQNDLTATELQYMSWTSTGGWSTSGTNFGSFNGQDARAVSLRSNPYSDQVMLMVNDGGKILRSDLWSGDAFASPIQLEANTNTTSGQPFTFIWDRYIPGTVTTTTTFTQTAAMTSPFVMPGGGAVTVTTYIQVTNGTLPAAPKLSARLGDSGTPLLTITTTPTVKDLTGGYYKLEWTGTLPNTVTIPAGDQISLTLIDYDSTYAFRVLYDSSTYPSAITLNTATAITVDSVGVFGAAYPAGSALAAGEAGQPVYVRFTISDPFGASDITGADLLITNSSNATVLSAALTNAYVVASTAGSKTYEYAWTPAAVDSFTIKVTAHEGTEGVIGTGQTTFITTARPDLSISKSDGGVTVIPGGSVSYSLNYSNAGLVAATGVVITEFLPAGATFNAALSTPGWTAVGSGEYRYSVGTLGAGASGSVTFAVTAATPVASTLEQLENTAQISDDGTHGADSNLDNNSASDSTPVNAAPDMTLLKSDGGTSTRAGGVVLYQLTYSNAGNQDAAGVTLQEMLPANTTFNASYSDVNWTYDGGVYELMVGDVAAGGSGTVIFAVNINDPLPVGVTEISNTASIEDSGLGGPDSNPGNNSSTDTTPVLIAPPEADLQITKTNNLTSVRPGDTVTYVITVTNAGGSDVTGAAFSDSVPASLSGVSYTTAVTGGASVSPATGSGNAIAGTLALPVGSTVTYTVTGQLAMDATGTLSNLASILPPAGYVDPNTGDNTAVDEDPIVPVSDLSLIKSYTYTDHDGSGSLTAGDTIVFALQVTNSGPNAAHNVIVRDPLPNGYLYVSDDAAASGGTYSGNGLWSVGTLGATAPSNTAVLHITATVYTAGTYTNVAEIYASDSFDPDSTPRNYVPTEDDYQSITPAVQPKSDLSLSKTMAVATDVDGNGILSIGDRVKFTLVLSNAGPNTAASVHVADLLPAGYTYYSHSASTGTYTSGTGDWNVGTLAVLSNATLEITATVVGGRPASAYTNYAQVSASGSFDPDSTPGNNSTTEDDDASASPLMSDLSVTKTVAFAPGGDADANGTPSVGDQIIFAVTLSNSGPGYATGVTLTDQLPTGYSYDDDDAGGSYNSATGLWTIGTLAPGASKTLNIIATILASGIYSNTAQVTANDHFDPDSTPNNNVASEDDQATVTLTPGATQVAPVAVNDFSLHNAPGPVTLNVTANDTDANLDLDPSKVDLDPSTTGIQATRTIAGQGTWAVDNSGNVTFTPQAGFTQDPSPINYTVQDSGGRTSNQASITVDYVPVASNDSSSGNATGTAVTLPLLANDTTGDAVVPSTVQIVGTPAPGVSLVVAGQGTWSVNPVTGAVTFTPLAGYAGDPTPIQYTVQDNDGNTSNAATVTVDYNQIAPVAVSDSSLHNAPGPVTLNVAANDSDANGDLDVGTVDLDPATAGQQSMLVVAGQGTWTVDAVGNVTFAPQVGFVTDPSPIRYVISDKTGLISNQATITVEYAPVDADESVTTPEDTLVSGNVLLNSTHDVGDTLAVTQFVVGGTTYSAGATATLAGVGTLVIAANGDFTFTPAPNYYGPVPVAAYTLTDGHGGSDTSTLVITVTSVNDLPFAANDAFTTAEDTAISGSVAGNDTLSGDGGNAWSIATPAGHGTAAVNPDGSFTYTPEANYNGTDSFTYTLTDANGDVSTATVELTITPVNDPPVANPDAATTPEDTPVTFPVLGNDTDIDGDARAIDSVTQPAHGSVAINPDGTVTYTPATNYNGPDSFTYTITDGHGGTSTATVDLTVTPVNDAPTDGDESVITAEDTPVAGNVLANAFDTEGDVLSVTEFIVGGTTYAAGSTAPISGVGTLTINADGAFTFIPAPDYNGPVPVATYTVSDGNGGTDSSTLTITVTPVNDAPVDGDESVTTPEDTPVSGNVLANATDIDGDTLRVTEFVVSGTTYAAGSTAVISGVGALTIGSDGAFTFTPEANYNGPVPVATYTLSDGNGGIDSSTLTIAVTPVNDAPVDGDETITTPEDTPVSGNVLANATDVDVDMLSVTQFVIGGMTYAAGETAILSGIGMLTINGDGAFTFTPEANYNGAVPVATYTVSDGNGGTDSSTLTIAVTPVNDAPVDGDETVTTLEDTPVTGNVLLNATDIDGNILSVTEFVIDGTTYAAGSTAPISGLGSLMIAANGDYTFTPEPNYNGPVPVATYTVSDGNGGTDASTLTIVVTPVNDAPVDGDESVSTPEDTPVSGNVLTNASDVDGDTLSVAQFVIDGTTYAAGSTALISGVGSLTINPDGAFTFTPEPNYSGPVPVATYTVSDGNGGTDNSTLTVAVTPVNDAPVDGDESVTTPEDTAVSGNVLANAADVDLDSLSVTEFVVGGMTYAAGETATLSGIGALTIGSDGAFTFTPEANYNGPVPVATYTVSDGNGGTDSSTLAITVTPVNDAPVDGEESVTTAEDTPVSGNVLLNATDVDGDTLSVTGFVVDGTSYLPGDSATLSGIGTLTISADGTFTFTPEANYNGPVPVASYTVSDGNGGTDSSTLTITVTPVNDAPVAVDDAYSTAEDTALTIAAPGVMANDSDVDLDALVVTGYTQPANGSVILNSDGSFVYTPNPNYNGPDSFTYAISDGNGGTASATVNLTVTPVNDPPVAADDLATTPEDQPLTLAPADLLGNDTDLDGDTLIITSVQDPVGGTVAIVDGNVVFTPALDYNGPASFTYTISDGNGGSSSATVYIAVTPVNDAPVANPDAATTPEDQPVTIPVLTNDTDVDGDPLAITGITQPDHGTVTVNPDGSVTYVPAADYNGADSFTYTISDGNGGSSTATVNLTITPVNDAPLDGDELLSTAEDAPICGNVLANATDVDGDALSVTEFVINGTTYSAGSTAPIAGVGSLTINSDGTFTFTPEANYNGPVPVATYTVSDGNGGTDTSTLTITVTPVNDAPIDGDESFTTPEDTPVSGNVLANASDVDDDMLNVTEFSVAGSTYAAGDTATLAGIGTLVINPDGSFTFTPETNYNGPVPSAAYIISDGHGGTDTSTLSLSITPVNDAPVANPDTAATPEDQPVTVAVLPNDTDVDGDPLTVTDVTQPDHGTVAINPDGTVIYTPAPNYHGDDSFTYTISDGNGGTSSATVVISVASVNDAPVDADELLTTPEDAPLTGNVLANASDVDGDALTVTNFEIGGTTYTAGDTAMVPGVGTLVINPDGSFTFTPELNYNGPVPVATYTVSDGNGGTDSSTLTIAVTPVNDAPVDGDESVSTPEDTPASGNVLANASDVDGDMLNVTEFTVDGSTYAAGDTATLAGVGTLVINPDGSFTFTPELNYNGLVPAATYTVSDGNGGTDTSTLSITVAPVNDAPVDGDESVSTPEDTPASGNVLTNASDVDGDMLTVTSFEIGGTTYTVGDTATMPGIGTLVINPDGSFTFTPELNYNGPVPVATYTVSDGQGGTDTSTLSIAVTPVNDAPVAVDDAYSTPEDTPLTLPAPGVMTNDTDVDHDPLAVVSYTQPVHGTVSLNPDGSFTYVPAANFNGADDFTYTITDGQGGTATATVSLTITPNNDAPVANPDSATTPEDQPVTIPVLTNDTDVDGDPLTIDSVTQPAHGTVVINPDGTVTYTPAGDYNGTDSFTYTVSDGNGGTSTATVDLTVTPVNDAPVDGDELLTTPEDTPLTGNLLANASDVDGDPLTVTEFVIGGSTYAAGDTATLAGVGTLVIAPNGDFTFTPEPNYNGPVPVATYTVSDGNGGSDSSTLTIAVTPVNDLPFAANDAFTTAEDTAISGSVAGNDTLSGDGGNAWAIATPAAHGMATVNPDGSFMYTPEANYNGTDSFTYTLTDANGDVSTATVELTITPVNDPPVAKPDAATTPEDTPVIIPVLANDTDVDGDSLAIDSVTQPAHGTVTMNPDGTVTYTPATDYNGPDSFTYTIIDGHGGSSTATVDLTVTPVNDAPTDGDESVTTPEDTPVSGNVLANSFDTEGDTLSVTQFVIDGTTYAAGTTAPISGVGTLLIAANGDYTFTPEANYNGPVPAATYTVSDGNGGTVSSTLTIAVTPVNDAPVDGDESVTTPEDTPVSGNVLANATDIDGDTLSVTEFVVSGTTYAAGSTALISGVGTLTIGADGAFTFTPEANYNGPVPVATYTVSDGNGGTDSSTLTIDITPVNDAPLDGDEIITTPEDTPISGNVLANAFDTEGDTLSVTEFVIDGTTYAAGSTAPIPGIGTLTINADGTFTFAPAPNYNGPVPLATYTVSDGNGGSDSSTLTIAVTPVNDAPVDGDETVSTPEDTPVSGNVLANATDVDLDTLSVTEFVIGGMTYAAGETATLAGIGTLTIASNGAFTFTPAADYNGPVPVATYTVSDGNGGTDTSTLAISVTPVNDPPAAVDDSHSTAEDTPLTISAPGVLGNDSDVDHDPLIVTAYTQPAHGSVAVNADGSFTYAPDADYNGTDAFAYTISDGNGGTATATVNLTITPVNDAPVDGDESIMTPEDTPVSGNVLLNVTDVDGGTPSVTQFSLAGDPAIYSAGDTASISGVGTLVIAAKGDYTFIPAADYNGPVPVATYTVADGNGGTDSSTLTIAVTPVNDAPVDGDESVTTPEDTPVSGNVLTNATDIDGDTLSVTQFVVNGTTYAAGSSAPISGVGTLTINANGAFTFTPEPDYNGPVPVATYTVSDGNGGTDTSTLTIAVTPVNDGPTDGDETVTTPEETPISGNVLSNASDVDLDTLSVTQFVVGGMTYAAGDTATLAGIGTLIIASNGAFTFTPAPNYNGPVPVATYTVSDGNGGTDLSTLTIAVTPVNDAPVDGDESVTTPEDTPVSGNVLANATDIDGESLSVTGFVIGGTSYLPGGTAILSGIGALTIGSDGAFTFTPAPNYNGPVPVATYTASDGHGGSDSSTLTIAVTPVNDLPFAADDALGTAEDIALTGSVAGNDTLSGDGGNTWAIATPAAHGAVAVHPDGSFTYTPDGDYNGLDSFTYTLTDINGDVSTAKVELTVTPVNDPPVAKPDAATTPQAQPVTIPVLTNDTDVDGDPLAIDSVTQPAHGSVAINRDGTVTYTPATDYNGPDSFTYTITDGHGGTSTATVDLTVTPVGNASIRIVKATNAADPMNPTGDEIAATQPGRSLPIGSPVTWTYQVTNTGSAPVVITSITDDFGSSSGADDFHPAPVLDGAYNVGDNDLDNVLDTTETWLYTSAGVVTYNVVPALTLGAAAGFGLLGLNNGNVSVNSNTSFIGDIAYSAGVTSTINTKIGSSPVATSSWQGAAYVHSGVGTFTYSSKDYLPSGGIVRNSATADARLDQASQDALALSSLIAELPTTIEAGALTDASPTSITYGTVDGIQTLNVVHISSLDFSGVHSITLQGDADDYFLFNVAGNFRFSQSSIDLLGVSASHVIWNFPTTVAYTSNILINKDTTVWNGTILAPNLPSGISVEYHNPAQFNGAIIANNITVHSAFNLKTVPFETYTGYTNTSTVVAQNAYNPSDSVTASASSSHCGATIDGDEAMTTPEETSISGNVLANGSGTLAVTQFVVSGITYSAGDTVTIAGVGTLTIAGNGDFAFTPAADYYGPVPLATYTVSDGHGGTDRSTFAIEVTPVNDPPVAKPDAATTPEDTPVTIPVLTNDTDVDGDSLAIDSVTQPAHGTLVINPDGTVTYTPATDYTGLDSFTYTITDGHGGTSTTTVALDVTSVEPADLLVAKTADQATVIAGQTIGFTVTLTNTGGKAANGIALTDLLPAGAGGDIYWTIDTTGTGLGSGTTPDMFQITGPMGSQVLTLSPSAPASLAPGATLTVHITSPTNAADAADGATAATGFDTTGTSAAGILSLGMLYRAHNANDYGVLGLINTQIVDSNVTIHGHVGVSKGGIVKHMAPSTITGNVYEYAAGQYSGPGVLGGSIIVDPTRLTEAGLNAINASAVAKALAPDFTFKSISRTTTVTATAASRADGINVVNINGSITLSGASLILSGSASDVFVVNISGNASFGSTGGLLLTGGLTANHVLYNFTGSSGTVKSQVNNVFYGTLLAPKYAMSLDGSFIGEVIAGGKSISLLSGAMLNAGSQVANTVAASATNVIPDESDSACASITLQPVSLALLSPSSTAAASAVSEACALSQGTYLVYLDNSLGNVTAEEEASIARAIASCSNALRPYGVRLVQVGSDRASDPVITIAIGDSTEFGGLEQGVFGVTHLNKSITLIGGWNWYAGADPTQIADSQYDLQTAASHELGHALGLGHSADPDSMMYSVLQAGTARRGLAPGDVAATPAPAAGVFCTESDALSGTAPDMLRATGGHAAPTAALNRLGRAAASPRRAPALPAAPRQDLFSVHSIAAGSDPVWRRLFGAEDDALLTGRASAAGA